VAGDFVQFSLSAALLKSAAGGLAFAGATINTGTVTLYFLNTDVVNPSVTQSGTLYAVVSRYP
jgi:hypothetical protein